MMYNNTQSRRHRWEEVKERRDHPYGLNVRGLSVPIGCIIDHAPDVPFTLDGGDTWISPRTGLEVKPCVGVPVPYIDQYGHVVYVQKPIMVEPPRPVVHISRQVVPNQRQQVQTNETDTLVNARTGEKYIVKRDQLHTFDTIFGDSSQSMRAETVYRQPVRHIQAEQTVLPRVEMREQTSPAPRTVKHSQPYTQTEKPNHPSIVETGTRDAFSSREIVTFKGVECHVPNGPRMYVYNSSRTEVTIIVGTWQMTFPI